MASVPGSPARELSRLVQLQRNKLQALESRLLGCEAELRDWEEATSEASEVRKTTAAAPVTYKKTSSLHTHPGSRVLLNRGTNDLRSQD